jgi:hypothetical protein
LHCWLNGQASVGFLPLAEIKIGAVSPAMSRLTPINGTGNLGGRSPTYANVVDQRLQGNSLFVIFLLVGKS